MHEQKEIIGNKVETPRTFVYREEQASEHLLENNDKTSYWNYIKPKQLINLVNPLSQEHDEHLFIVVHQVFELWFKQVLHELSESIELIVGEKKAPIGSSKEQENLQLIIKYLDRSDKIIRHATTAFDILETMDGSEFLEFRDYLGDGSGFQSTQFREMELLFGQRERPLVVSKKDGTYMSIEEKFKEMECPFYHLEVIKEAGEKVSLKEAVYKWLAQVQIPNLTNWIDYILDLKNHLGTKAEGHDSASQFFTDNENPEVSHVRQVALYVMTYRYHHKWHFYAKVLQLLLKLEQSIILWRSRHPRMVEMIMIGRRVGTGGSSGVAYLDSTTLPQYRVFSDLIRIRGESVASNKIHGKLNEEGIWSLGDN